MKLEDIVHTFASGGRAETLATATVAAARYGPTRRVLMGCLDRYINRRLGGAHEASQPRPAQVIQDQMDILRALVHSADRAIRRGHVSRVPLRKMLRGLMNAFLGLEQWAARERFREEHDGRHPPSFLTISPGKLCNLRCKGCYASSGGDSEKLDWEVFDRIITEASDLWGSGFIVISGGEPLAYRSQGKGILDAAAKHQDAFFLMYTNGTLIDSKMAARMAEVGNLTPAISVEGFEERTDARRGEGVFQRVLRSMANLRQVGVPFGISLTATCENCEEILSDAFLDFFFEEQGAVYGWIFQYMPIGRGLTLDLLPTPQQRVWMWERTWQVIRERKYFLADFWNLGTCSRGCISAGHPGGYLYVDWNGKVMPCVFVPYSPVNINDAYREDKTLNDVLEEPFFNAIREWQDAYGFAATRPEEHDNWLMPCPIRDHHRDFRRILEATEPDPEDEAALQAMIDPAYRDGLIQYNEAVARLMDPIWEREYVGGDGRGSQSGGGRAAGDDVHRTGRHV
ncbi:MAG: radical SAM protein [Chloroflexota bacterium]|nr:radical SAM protein [Chloroflexota bacterium]